MIRVVATPRDFGVLIQGLASDDAAGVVVIAVAVVVVDVVVLVLVAVVIRSEGVFRTGI